MDLGDIMFSEISQKKTNTEYFLTYMWNLKHKTKNEYNKTKQTHRYREQTYGYQRGKGGG